MDNRKHIQKTIDYIENNLKSEMNPSELSVIAGYSYVHFCRLFSHYTGLAPTEFITRRKLLNAAYEISQGKTKIDASLSYGFETYAGFYKAFRHEFNCSPSDFNYGKKPYRINILQKEHLMISKQKIKKILENWNLQNETISNIYNENTKNQNENAYYIGKDYIIKFTANPANIKNSIAINKALSVCNLPYSEIVKTISDEDSIQFGELSFIVTKRITGKPLLCRDIFTNPNIAITIGQNIAKLHNALKLLDESNYSKTNLLQDTIHNSKKIDLPDLNFDFINKFKYIYEQLPKQIIHRDINPSNLIFEKNKFKGFIDFDLSEINIRIFDICYCATAILSECFSDSETDINNWLNIFHKIASGYHSINPLTAEEKQALPYVIYSIQIICIAYFSKYDEYKNLAEINKNMLKSIHNIFENEYQ